MEEFGRTIQLAEFPKREKKIVKKNVLSMMIDIYYLISIYKILFEIGTPGSKQCYDICST